MINENSPGQVPPLFIPKYNKPIPLALRRFLDDGGEDDEDEEMGSTVSEDDRQTSKSKYTSYSMTSSVIRRNQGLQNVDDHFDKIFDEYADEQIGPLDSRQINAKGASIDDDLVQQVVQQFEEQQVQR